MLAAPNPLLESYVKLTEFLGSALGPDYEVVLHDLSDPEHSVITIANNHISGRVSGAPLTNMGRSLLREESCRETEYHLHHYGLAANGKKLRSSTFFIRKDGDVIGMLCVNFDDSRYRSVIGQMLALCHPDSLMSNVQYDGNHERTDRGITREPSQGPIENEVIHAVNQELIRMGLSAERLAAEERKHIVSSLEANGIFLIKNAVKVVAAELHCAPTSIYRYLSQIKTTREHNEPGLFQ